MARRFFGLRRQSGSGDGAFGRAMGFQIFTRPVRAKAVSRCACHRSPKPGGFPAALAEIALVAGAFEDTVSAVMKMLSARAKIV